MSYLGNLNPYMTPADYAEELRRRQAMLRGQTPQAEQMSPNKPPQMSMPPTNAYGLTPEQMAAMSNDTSAEEAKIKNQMEYANALRGTKSAGPRQLGNVVVNNPWEGLEVGFNRALGGYLAGKSDKKLDALDAQKDEKAQALAALEESKYALDKDVKLRTLGVAEDGNRRAEEDRNRLVAGDEDTYIDAEGNLHTGFWQEDPKIGERQFISGGEPLDISRMKPYEDLRTTGYSSNTLKNPEEYQDRDGNTYYLATLNGQVVNRLTGKPVSEEQIANIESGAFRKMDSISESGLASRVEGFNKDTKGLRQLANDYSDMLQVLADNGIDLTTDDPLGWLEKGDGVFQDIVRMTSDNEGVVYSAIKAVLNQEVRETAGMSQTVAEIQRINSKYGDKIFSDPKVMGEALRRLGGKIQRDVAESTAGAAPSVLSQYRYTLEKANTPDWTQWSLVDEADAAQAASEARPDPSASSFAGENLRGRGVGARVNYNVNDPLGLGKDLGEYTEEELKQYLEGG